MSGAPALVCLPSPVLGPASWNPTAAALRRLGHDVRVAKSAVAPASPSEVVGALGQQLPRHQPVVLVPHSNAGLYVPALTQVADVAGVVFVDAGIPPGQGAVRLVPAQLDAMLVGLVDADGFLPPWTQWWDDASTLFADDDTRAAVEAEQQRLPLAYFRSTVDVPVGWAARPCGYVAFGTTYADETRRAQAAGWPVEVLAGRHLHTVVDPDEVALAIDAILVDLGLGPPSR